MLIDDQIPYFQISNSLSMADQKFQDLQSEIYWEKLKIRHLLERSFSQKTERSSQILQVIDGIDTDEKKVVALCYILAMVDHVKDLQKEIIHLRRARD